MAPATVASWSAASSSRTPSPTSSARIVDDLDASRAQVVVTLRPLARILPSQWQQYVQSNMRASYDTWLDAMFNKERRRLSPSFWHRHRHDQLIARWAEVVGPDRVTVVALDEHDHDFALRAFERLTGLRAGTLVSTPDVTNRSLTMPEVESIRAFNVAFRHEGLQRPLHSQVMNFGAARYLRQFEAPADAPRVETPQWALDKAGAIAREMVDAIAASGVRVIGDLESLAEVPASGLSGDPQPPVTVPPAIAATMAMGVLYSSGLARDGAAPKDTKASWNRSSRVPIRGEPLELIRVPTRDLFGLLVRRGSGLGPARAAGWTAGNAGLDRGQLRLERRADAAHGLGHVDLRRVDDDLGVARRLVGRRDPRELGDLARAGARVEPLPVPGLAHGERRVDPHEQERAGARRQRPGVAAPGVERGDRGRDRDPAVRCDQCRHPGDPIDVDLSRLRVEAEAPRQVLADLVAVEQRDAPRRPRRRARRPARARSSTFPSRTGR